MNQPTLPRLGVFPPGLRESQAISTSSPAAASGMWAQMPSRSVRTGSPANFIANAPSFRGRAEPPPASFVGAGRDNYPQIAYVASCYHRLHQRHALLRCLCSLMHTGTLLCFLSLSNTWCSLIPPKQRSRKMSLSHTHPHTHAHKHISQGNTTENR